MEVMFFYEDKEFLPRNEELSETMNSPMEKSDENKVIFEQLDGPKVIKFSYHAGCLNFRVNMVGEKGQAHLLELAQKLEMQDVPYVEAYIHLKII